MFNEGQPGEKAVNALARFLLMLTNRRPQAVLLLEGINDISSGTSPTQVATSLRQMVDESINIGVPVLLATMYQTYEVVDPDGNLRRNGASAVPALNTEIKKIPAGRLNVHIVDLYPIMNNRDYVGADGIHTTDAGFTVMASAFLDAIEAAFPVRSGGAQ
jgi:lysophospholipase L1-like esterase